MGALTRENITPYRYHATKTQRDTVPPPPHKIRRQQVTSFRQPRRAKCNTAMTSARTPRAAPACAAYIGYFVLSTAHARSAQISAAGSVVASTRCRWLRWCCHGAAGRNTAALDTLWCTLTLPARCDGYQRSARVATSADFATSRDVAYVSRRRWQRRGTQNAVARVAADFDIAAISILIIHTVKISFFMNRLIYHWLMVITDIILTHFNNNNTDNNNGHSHQDSTSSSN